MCETPVSNGTANPQGYSAEIYSAAKHISDTIDYIKAQAIKVWQDPKKRLPIEAEMILQTVNVLKVLPIPQLKLILLILGIIVVLVILLQKYLS